MRSSLVMGAAVACVAVFAATGVACSSNTGSPSASCDNPVSTTTVTLIDYAFTPACTAAAPGATLTIKDAGAIPHTFTVTGTSIDVAVSAGESKQVALTGLAPGTYEVVCSLHPQMKGSLKVG